MYVYMHMCNCICIYVCMCCMCRYINIYNWMELSKIFNHCLFNLMYTYVHAYTPVCVFIHNMYNIKNALYIQICNTYIYIHICKIKAYKHTLFLMKYSYFRCSKFISPLSLWFWVRNNLVFVDCHINFC